ncbi:hypothetical protein ENSA5_13420 [Enhygromyxa salina]|uniref:Uncharacterized protein n=1 Tax=Enhygromyxa salina TaxID=215803 RepID=A0A2S9YF43_9BACT|nr:hypothetical protein ENSA5_13420 [Enhygromyxa salina]
MPGLGLRRGLAGHKPEPQPEPEPEPQPEPEPEPEKPSLEPESKANEGIDHDDLLDPWQ